MVTFLMNEEKIEGGRNPSHLYRKLFYEFGHGRYAREGRETATFETHPL